MSNKVTTKAVEMKQVGPTIVKASKLRPRSLAATMGEGIKPLTGLSWRPASRIGSQIDPSLTSYQRLWL